MAETFDEDFDDDADKVGHVVGGGVVGGGDVGADSDESDKVDEVDEVDEIVAAWHRERPDLDVEPLQILSRISRLAEVLDDRRAAAFVEHGLQAHEFDVLAALRRRGTPFEMTAGALCAATHVTSGTMTSRLDRLATRKLVVRRPDDEDGRLVRVRLTAAGRRRIDSAFAALLDSERELVAALVEGKRERLAAGLRELLAAAVSRS